MSAAPRYLASPRAPAGRAAREQAFYLRGPRETVFAFLHPAIGGRARVPVLICPPFGWEEVCSHRSRRTWAQHLAADGHPTLRIDLPSTGDSGGFPGDDARLAAWTDAVADAARWLAQDSAQGSVAAIGIGLGGLLACAAAAGGAPIDQAVLWAAPARGSALVRELRAFERLETPTYSPGAARVTSADAGALAAGGFALSAETVAALEALDLAALGFPAARLRRALLLGRDHIAVDARLREALEGAGVQVRVAPGEGFGAMMAEPQEARPPRATFELVDCWLAQDELSSSAYTDAPRPRVAPARAAVLPARTLRPAVPGAVARAQTADLMAAGSAIAETPLSIEVPFGRLFGVHAYPVEPQEHGLGALLLNAGAIRRIGPNRMWVEIARRWAARGIPTLRIDLEGLGDADGDSSRFADVAELYVPEFVAQVRAAMNHLQKLGIARRFVLAGLCSGAYWSFHGAVQDERVAAAFMLNPRTLFWDATVENVRYLRRGLLDPSSWRMIMRGDVSLARVARVARAAPQSLAASTRARWLARGEPDELELTLDRLNSMGKQIAFVFSEHEPLHEELARQGRFERPERWPNIKLEVLPGRDHTLRPAQSQRRAHDALDRALLRELERIAS